jgi:ATP-binding protein involved in chromosome partitioning
MASPTKDQILDALRKVKGPDLSGNIVELGLVADDDIAIAGDKVILAVRVPSDRAAELEPLRQAAEKVVTSVPGVASAMVALTAERRVTGVPSASPVGARAGNGRAAPPAPTAAAAPAGPTPEAGVKQVEAVIAVASGKGGVGKSTTAVNLALGLQANGLKVGLLDADIYGPSMPRLLRITGRPQQVMGRILKPMEGYGLKVMSMGFLVDEETPMIWRGPMVISALTQMLNEVQWGKLDVLVVDMPPGTGDAQLTMAQQVPLAGAVIVSTPQDLALIDARKGLNMFRRTEVPVLGIVENMSYFICPNCGHQSNIFGHGGAEAEAARIGVPFLGGVPLDMEVREKSDAGTPVVISAPDSEVAKIYRQIAGRVIERLKAEREMVERKAPEIVIES